MSANCTVCSGTGQETRSCPSCGGWGERVLDRHTNWTVDCSECDGRRYVEDSCSVCGGSGFSGYDGWEEASSPAFQTSTLENLRLLPDSPDAQSLKASYFWGLSSRANEPVLITDQERKAAIVSNSPGVFVIEKYSDARPQPWLVRGAFENEQVTQNQEIITAAATRFSVEGDLVRAVVWDETTRFPRRQVPGMAGEAAVTLPMNIPVDWRKDLGISDAALQDPRVNIEAGVFLLSQLQDRILHPTPEKLFSIYDDLATLTVSTRGATIAWYLENRPWLWSTKDKENMYDREDHEIKAVPSSGATNNSGGFMGGSLLSTIMGATPENSHQTNKKVTNESSTQKDDSWNKRNAHDFESQVARKTAEAWKRKGEKSAPLPMTVEERVLRNIQKKVESQIKSELKKETQNAILGKEPFKRSIPERVKPLSEYKEIKERMTDDQAPSASNFGDQITDLWRKATDALNGKEDAPKKTKKK